MVKPNYKLIAPYPILGVKNCSFDECLIYLAKIEVVGVDIETTRKFKGKYGKDEGLDPYLSEIVMIQVGDINQQFVIDARIPEYRDNILRLVNLLTTKICVGQNIKFEYKHFLVNYSIRLERVYDTMVSDQIIYNGYTMLKGKKLLFGLKDLNERYLNITVDKTTRLEFLRIGNHQFSKRQVEYGAEDILYPLMIRELQLVKLAKEGMLKCHEIEMKFLVCLGDIECKGLHFDKDIWTKAYETAIENFKKTETILNNYVIENYPAFTNRQLSLFEDGVKCGIQWSSSKQVIKFFDSLGICPEAESKTTKQIAKTVESKEMKVVLTREDLRPEDRELINNYLKLKKYEQSITTFGIDFFKYVHPITGRLHSSYKQILNTGRISSLNPNLQNIPSTKDYRKAFTAPNGYKIINCDYSG